MKKTNSIYLIISSILLISCSNPYKVETYLDKESQKERLLDIITYVYLVPQGVDTQNKHLPIYRSTYAKFLPQFSFANYYISKEDSLHYFYVIRPARSAKAGTQRGVAGRYRLSTDGKIYDFEEIFNTTIMSIDSLRTIGEKIFKEVLLNKGSLGKYEGYTPYIEWPSANSFYDKTRHEWRYK